MSMRRISARVVSMCLVMLALAPAAMAQPLTINFHNLNLNYNSDDVYVFFTNAGATFGGGTPINPLTSYSLTTIGSSVQTHALGGRIYYSLGAPIPNGAEPTVVGNQVLYDKWELTYPGGVANLTAVDFVGIPTKLETYKGVALDKTLQYNLTTQQYINKLSPLSGGNAVEYKGGMPGISNFLRVLAPKFAPSDYPSMQPYIDNVKARAGTSDPGLPTVGIADLQGMFFGAATPPTSEDRFKTQTFNFVSTFDAGGDLLLTGGGTQVGTGHVLTIPAGQLSQAVYTGAASGVLLDGSPRPTTGGTNDVWEAAIRDVFGGFSTGFIGSTIVDPATGKSFGSEPSEDWFKASILYDALQPDHDSIAEGFYFDPYAGIVFKNGTVYGTAYADLLASSIVQAPLTGGVDRIEFFILGGAGASIPEPAAGVAALIGLLGCFFFCSRGARGLRRGESRVARVHTRRCV